MTNEQLNTALYKKIFEEHNRFVKELKSSTPELVIECAYELVIKEDILLYLEENELDAKQCKVLLREKEPLNKLFHAWQKYEGNHMREIEDCIENFADKLVKENILKTKDRGR